MASEDIAAEALNLSERGLFIRTEEDFRVGETLRLRFPLGDRELDCEGLITWTRRVSRGGEPAGIGVEFRQLASSDLECIKSLIGSNNEHEVTVRLTGLPSPIRARAAVAGDLLSLHTELPFLRIGTVTQFALAGDAQSHRGKIRRVAIEPGSGPLVPRLRIDIAVLGAGGTDQEEPAPAAVDGLNTNTTPANPGDTAGASYSDRELSPPDLVVLPEAAPSWVETRGEETVQIRKARGPWLVTAPIAAVAIAVIGFAAYQPSAANPSPAIAMADDTSTEGVPVAAHEESILAAAAPTETAVANEAVDDSELADQHVEPSPIALPEEEPVATELPLHVSTAGARTTVSMQLRHGSADQLSHYLLADPDGIAITLPDATLAATARVHETHSGHAKRIWVRRLEAGAQVRIFFPDKSPRSYRVEASGSTIKAVIEGRPRATTPTDE